MTRELGHDLDMDVDSQIDERNAVPKPKANKKGRSNGKENALPGETVGTDREDGVRIRFPTVLS
jgi:hypothetical protein